jgi:predicted nucleic acid-binding protein
MTAFARFLVAELARICRRQHVAECQGRHSIIDDLRACPMLRDPDDEMVLEVAVNGRADRLLTFNERDFAGADRLGLTVERPGPAWRTWRGG